MARHLVPGKNNAHTIYNIQSDIVRAAHPVIKKLVEDKIVTFQTPPKNLGVSIPSLTPASKFFGKTLDLQFGEQADGFVAAKAVLSINMEDGSAAVCSILGDKGELYSLPKFLEGEAGSSIKMLVQQAKLILMEDALQFFYGKKGVSPDSPDLEQKVGRIAERLASICGQELRNTDFDLYQKFLENLEVIAFAKKNSPEKLLRTFSKLFSHEDLWVRFLALRASAGIAQVLSPEEKKELLNLCIKCVLDSDKLETKKGPQMGIKPMDVMFGKFIPLRDAVKLGGLDNIHNELVDYLGMMNTARGGFKLVFQRDRIQEALYARDEIFENFQEVFRGLRNQLYSDAGLAKDNVRTAAVELVGANATIEDSGAITFLLGIVDSGVGNNAYAAGVEIGKIYGIPAMENNRTIREDFAYDLKAAMDEATPGLKFASLDSTLQKYYKYVRKRNV